MQLQHQIKRTKNIFKNGVLEGEEARITPVGARQDFPFKSPRGLIVQRREIARNGDDVSFFTTRGKRRRKTPQPKSPTSREGRV
ncbi:hypothetical protein SLEP1_g50912 [Rubroshorea leprosula]|uniref:Uncharacterized protein n=1 Tax=Rubroshorea leprosula TaxID=152421 RepID=A0AAV5M2E5_9ROSI|nr:hypothetical protein SLEP1_g50912 [Rubroshorea leprosula]